MPTQTTSTQRAPRAARRTIPRPRGLPGLGHGLALLRDPLAMLRKGVAEVGPVFEVRAPGRRLVVLSGREANRFAGKEGRRALITAPFWGRLTEHHGSPHALIAVDGDEHSKQRRLFGKALSKRAVDRHRDGCAALVMRTLLDDDRSGAIVPVVDRCRLLVARMVHHTLSEGAPPIEERTARAMMEAFRWETNVLLLGKWPRAALFLPRYRRYAEAATRFITETVERELGPGASPEGWFGRVAEGRERYPEWFGDGDLHIAALLPFIAGVDTVGATLSFALAEVYRRPALLKRLRAEVAEAWSDDAPPTVSALADLPTLRGVVLECLRLYPAAFGMSRQAAHAFEFGGYRVPAGRDVLVFTTATHFDPRYFPRPDAFDPGRLARGEFKGADIFMPYGAGPHICLGAGMGEAMLLLALATIVRGFDLAPTGHQPPRYVFDPSLTLDPASKLRVR